MPPLYDADKQRRLACFEALQAYCREHRYPEVAWHELQRSPYEHVGDFVLERPWEPRLGLPTAGVSAVQLYALARTNPETKQLCVAVSRIFDDRRLYRHVYSGHGIRAGYGVMP